MVTGSAVITSDTGVFSGSRPRARTRTSASRSVKIPISRPSRTTGKAPIFWSAINCAASRTEAFTAQLTAAAPELVARLRAGRRVSPVAGMLRTPNVLRRAYGPGWALAGDAGYHRDAVTGHGISDAYRDAHLLAAALDRVLRGGADESSALADYQRRRDSALREVFELTIALAAYPPVPEFVDLQKRLSRAIDVAAAELAPADVPV